MTVKKFFCFAVLASSVLASADTETKETPVNIPTQFGRMDFTVSEPGAEEILKIFDTDKNGSISKDERESVIPLMAALLPKIDANAERTAFVTRFVKYWRFIPTYMSFFKDGSVPLIRTDFPPFVKLPNPRRPESIEVLANPASKRILVADSKKFPPRFTTPKPSITENLESPFQIKKRFDKNRDGNLDEQETINLLLEMRFKFDLAKSNGARDKIINRYAEVLADLNKEEFIVFWGIDSSFKIFKDPLSGKWQADAPPLQNLPFGQHPSTDFAQKLQQKDPSGLALAEFLDMLQRENPLKRVEIIEDKLPEYLNDEYPSGGSAAWLDRAFKLGYGLANNGSEITGHDLERIIEYINEKHENVFVPIFFTDPEAAVDIIAKISFENQKNFSPKEAEAMDIYYKSRNQ